MAGPHDLEGLFDVFIQSCFEFKSCPKEAMSVGDRINEFVTQRQLVAGGNHRDWVILDQQNGETREQNGDQKGHVGSEGKGQSALPRKVLVLGSGGLSIGQAGEFDYSGSQVYTCTHSYQYVLEIHPH